MLSTEPYCASHNSGVLPLQCVRLSHVSPISSSGQNVIQDSRFYRRRGDCRVVRFVVASRTGADSPRPMMPWRCGSSGWRTSCGSSPARTRSCNTATVSSKSGCGSRGRAPAAGGQPRVPSPVSPPSAVRSPMQPLSTAAGSRAMQPQRLRQQQPQIAAPAPIIQEPASAAGARPPPRQCLRSQPEPERARRAARARWRADADRQ